MRANALRQAVHTVPQLSPKITTTAVCLLAAISLSACDWVDSAGGSNNTAPTTAIVLDDGQTTAQQSIEENTTASVTVRGSDNEGSVRSWQWSSLPIDQGNLSECSSEPGFQSSVAATSFLEACASETDCRMDFELQSSELDTAVFIARTPVLNAPVGLKFRLTTTDNDGGRGVCLLSVNDPPIPQDDTFSVLEGTTLDIRGSDVNLLTNDDDDEDDVNSKPLKVSTTPIRAPAAANVFELREDGGFSYSFAGVNLFQDVTDSFVYSVTDGQFTANATVTINIIARNDPPIANGSISIIEETAGVDFSLDFADFYSDPEGNTLGFSVLDGEFPPSGGIELSTLGVLGGVGEPSDVGDYTFTMLVDDG